MPSPEREASSTESSLPLEFGAADEALLGQAFTTAGDGPRAWRLNLEAHRLSLIDGFDRLLSWPSLRSVRRYEHQERTALRVLRDLRGRAILADEVGLGKTIEAGLILKEYTIRVRSNGSFRVVDGNEERMQAGDAPYLSMDDLFAKMEAELAEDQQPGQPSVFAKADFDRRDGHVIRYLRSVRATRERLEVKVSDLK